MSTVAAELMRMEEHNRTMFPAPPRKIVVIRAGSHYKARFDGEATFCFGDNPQHATKRLKFFAGQI